MCVRSNPLLGLESGPHSSGIYYTKMVRKHLRLRSLFYYRLKIKTRYKESKITPYEYAIFSGETDSPEGISDKELRFKKDEKET